ncbi:hypothetical protein [Paracraurococcus ruber]|uniref:Transposase n=2 Tax=Paracraurococcus ruber TaxID=77675 RepID=A0ABS1CV51_9PROT|nr:hypothetical protein [Paracraurococcus ruber]MBK1658233.1 hypothetical protein [Paracraurococcus ruber]
MIRGRVQHLTDGLDVAGATFASGIDRCCPAACDLSGFDAHRWVLRSLLAEALDLLAEMNRMRDIQWHLPRAAGRHRARPVASPRRPRALTYWPPVRRRPRRAAAECLGTPA